MSILYFFDINHPCTYFDVVVAASSTEFIGQSRQELKTRIKPLRQHTTIRACGQQRVASPVPDPYNLSILLVQKILPIE